jgi:uncharacterized membrane protein YeaQ/YmgE (transglycosylase-associated protein family)
VGEYFSLGNLLWTIIGGAIIGVLARFFIPGKVPMKLWLTIVVGIVGMIVGDLIARALGVYNTAGFDWTRHFLQIVSAIILILIVRAITGRRSSSAT